MQDCPQSRSSLAGSPGLPTLLISPGSLPDRLWGWTVVESQGDLGYPGVQQGAGGPRGGIWPLWGVEKPSGKR